MAETIKTYSLADPDTPIPMDRDEFYKEQIAVFKETGAPTKAVETVIVFIFNDSGQVLLQKRSFDKFHNSGLIDKTIGGHVQYEDTINHTVMMETVQELETPSIVLNNIKDFNKTLKVLNNYLETIAITKHFETKIFPNVRIINNEPIKIAHKAHVFFGVYNGRVKPADKEAQGILFYTLEETRNEMKKFPDLFTHDMHVLMDELCEDMEDFQKLILRK